MDPVAQQVINPELSSGERLLWCGRPRRGLLLRGQDAYLIPFSLIWCGFVTLFMIDTGDESAPPIFRIVGLLFMVFGCYHLFGRFFIDALVRARTYYGLTSERVVISSGIFSRNLQSINLRALTEMELSEHSGGQGTITLGPKNPYQTFY